MIVYLAKIKKESKTAIQDRFYSTFKKCRHSVVQTPVDEKQALIWRSTEKIKFGKNEFWRLTAKINFALARTKFGEFSTVSTISPKLVLAKISSLKVCYWPLGVIRAGV